MNAPPYELLGVNTILHYSMKPSQFARQAENFDPERNLNMTLARACDCAVHENDEVI